MASSNGRTKSFARRRRILPRRSSTVDPIAGRVHRAHRAAYGVERSAPSCRSLPRRTTSSRPASGIHPASRLGPSAMLPPPGDPTRPVRDRGVVRRPQGVETAAA